MYTLHQFLYTANELLKTEINESVIEEVKNAAQSKFNEINGDNNNNFIKDCIRSTIQKGDIFYSDMGHGIGLEQGGIRPVIIIQNDIGNKYSQTVLVAIVISQISKTKLPTQFEISSEEYGLTKDFVILLEQIRTVDKKRLKEKMVMLIIQI